MERGVAHQTVEDIEELGPDFDVNVKSAGLFLQSAETSLPDAQFFLSCFDNHVAMVIDEIRPFALNDSSMLAGTSTIAAQAVAMKYTAIELVWSGLMLEKRDTHAVFLW